MYQLIRQYQGLRIAHGGQDTRIGMITAVEHQCRFRSEQLCERLFQFRVDGEVAGQQAR